MSLNISLNVSIAPTTREHMPLVALGLGLPLFMILSQRWAAPSVLKAHRAREVVSLSYCVSLPQGSLLPRQYSDLLQCDKIPEKFKHPSTCLCFLQEVFVERNRTHWQPFLWSKMTLH